MSSFAMFAGLLGGYFVLLLALSRWRAAPVPSRAVQLLRAFFPSWRFFEDVGFVPELLLRVGATAEALGPWQPALPRPHRRLRTLVVGAEVNLLLAARSLLQQLEADLEATDEAAPEQLTTTVSYRLVSDLVQLQLRGRNAAAGTVFQWKLTRVAPDGVAHDAIVSTVSRLP